MAEAGKVSSQPSFRQRGGDWVIAQFILMAAVLVLPWPFRRQGWGAWSIWPGGVLLVLAGAVGLSGVLALGRGTTPLPKPAKHARLIQSGIYARVRHPLYLSVMLASVGWALIWQSWASFVVALGLIPFFRAKARREEDWLRQTFREYAEYEKRVPPFLPRLRSTWK